MKRSFRTIRFGPLFLLSLLVIFAGGCSAHRAEVNKPVADPTEQVPLSQQQDDGFELESEFIDIDTETVFDPLSGYNRVMTQVNDKVYLWVLKPVAKGYRFVIPEGGRLAVGRAFNNLLMPVRFANNLLQLKLAQAGTELARFAVNSTIGILGLRDPAAEVFDLQAYPEDFGQTLGHYGVGSGFHLVLPLLGPSNLRDTVGLIPDHFLDPVTYIDHSETAMAVRAARLVNKTSLHIGEYESLKKDAVDLYPFLRDAYEQRRKKQILE